MTQWDVWLARRLRILHPVAHLYATIGRTQARLGHRGAVLTIVALWHTVVGVTLVGYTFQGGAYELLTVIPEWTWATLFLTSAGWAGGSAWQRQGADRGGFYISAIVTMLWGVWLGVPAVFFNADAGTARSAGAFITIGALLIVTGGWRER